MDKKQTVFIDKTWLEGRLEPIKAAGDLLASMRHSLVDMLVEMGCEVIFDGKTADESTIFVNPYCDYASYGGDALRWKQERDDKIKTMIKNDVKVPQTVCAGAYFDKPFIPCVLKNEVRSRGVEKFLIETPGQFELVKKFFAEVVEKNEFLKKYSDAFGFQQFLETPAGYNTSLRVLASSSGSIMASAIKYCAAIPIKQKTKQGEFDKYLSNPGSPYFINSRNIVSNSSAGGKQICLDKKQFNKQECEILAAHGIDPDSAQVPHDVASAAIKIAEKCGRKLGCISGIDFIYNKNDSRWYFLEANINPGLHVYAEINGYKIDTAPTSDIEKATQNFLNVKALDIIARKHSVALSMDKKGKKI